MPLLNIRCTKTTIRCISIELNAALIMSNTSTQIEFISVRRERNLHLIEHVQFLTFQIDENADQMHFNYEGGFEFSSLLEVFRFFIPCCLQANSIESRTNLPSLPVILIVSTLFFQGWKGLAGAMGDERTGDELARTYVTLTVEKESPSKTASSKFKNYFQYSKKHLLNSKTISIAFALKWKEKPILFFMYIFFLFNLIPFPN